jgi:hypothetical protein
MAAFVITPNGAGAISFAAMIGDNSEFTVASKWWIKRPVPRFPRYGMDFQKGPAQAGQIVRRHDFDGRPIDNIEVMYIDTSAANILTSFVNDLKAMVNIQGGSSVSIPDWPNDATYANPFPACELIMCEPIVYRDGRYIKPTGGGTPTPTFKMHVTMAFKQLRLS